MIDKKLLEIVRDPQNPIALTLIVNGAVLSGMLISEQEFFIESLRASKAGYGGRAEKIVQQHRRSQSEGFSLGSG